MHKKSAMPKRGRGGLLATLLAVAAWCAPGPASAQETEPNSDCASAQDLGALELPAVIAGSLDSDPTGADVDFFRLTAAEGARLEVNVDGASGGGGTLEDSFLGFFSTASGSCQLVSSNDDVGPGRDSRLILDVPVGGVVILAVAGCCDEDFNGDHGRAGSYTLKVEVDQSGSIAGRLVDALSGEPLTVFPNAVSLFQCDSPAADASCFFFAEKPVSTDGRFVYPDPNSSFEEPLQPGISFRIDATAFGFATASRRFELVPQQALDLGDIPLTPAAVVGSIRARVLERRTNAPISGNPPLFGRINLLSCDASGEFCNLHRSASLDGKGRAVFRGRTDFFENLITPGTYRIEASSDEHPEARSAPFTVGEGEDARVVLRLTSRFPLKVSEIRPCGAPPTEGGRCAYSARVRNITRGTIVGGGWSLVQGSDLGRVTGSTEFQTDQPTRFTLPPNESLELEFGFNVPASLNDGATFCADLQLGRGPAADLSLYYNVLRRQSLFCIRKGPTGIFAVATPEQERAIRAERAAREAGPAPGTAAAIPIK